MAEDLEAGNRFLLEVPTQISTQHHDFIYRTQKGKQRMNKSQQKVLDRKIKEFPTTSPNQCVICRKEIMISIRRGTRICSELCQKALDEPMEES